MPSLVGAAAHAQGLLDSDLDALRVAVQAYRGSPRKLAVASALEDAAKAEHAVGRRSAASVFGQEALGIYDSLGVVRAAERVKALLRGVGVRHMTPRPGDDTGWGALTRAERRVAELVTQGMTNHAVAAALSVSPHTVDSHLRKVFRKLGVTSRVGLTRLALRKDHEKS
ncbi:helix-turn-helix transcriptional regulator [Streptomyces sp. SLBN-118]|uniref:helix-turn-helix transcriptional regulator n=1 Tax=Streptomyces sp. SLBN-118 TaxID=2768454 RepID=UPI00135A8735|nr:helix-turn-helix transcriptional regulator [Streptomyces sp. SLBN-118]